MRIFVDLNISGVVPMEDDKSVEGESSLIGNYFVLNFNTKEKFFLL